ncbi:MAG: DUF86 domain-containing protein [Salinibacter sp.]|uniref:type VII toxin-antitoxin system HepT family RNase toxin n=1 Tax=Salinibacter sp. TaxID=2065818 RepID=UPI002FC31D07
MVRPETLRRRLQKLDEFIEYLEYAQAYSFEEFASNVEVYSAVERNLHLSIEALNDMAGHLIVDENLGTFERAQDLPALLEEHGFIDEGDRDTWQDMIGFRNVLVHEYADIDRRTVYAALQENLDDIRRLSHVFDRFLE